MTDYADLIRRLRAMSDKEADSPVQVSGLLALLDGAADAIEALVKEKL